MHHFTAYTYKSLSVAGQTEELWQVYVPRQALQHDFLMHGIMAVASLHISHERPDDSEKYFEMSTKHQQNAFSLFKNQLHHVNNYNCHALFAFAVLAMVFAVGPAPQTSAMSPAAMMERIFVLADFLQGIGTVTELGREWIVDGPFGDLADIANRLQPLDLTEDDQRLLTRLRQLNDSFLEVVDPTAHASIRASIDVLEMAFRGGELLTLAWLSMCGDGYMNLLRQGQRLAQLTLLHWCILLNRLRRLWWVKDHATLLFNHIAPNLIPLGNDCSDAIEEIRSRLEEGTPVASDLHQAENVA